jgi:hypothetical protein
LPVSFLLDGQPGLFLGRQHDNVGRHMKALLVTPADFCSESPI